MKKNLWIRFLSAASIFTVLYGATIGALNIDHSRFASIYLFAGCSVLAVISYIYRDREALIASFIFTVINAIGVYRWILT